MRNKITAFVLAFFIIFAPLYANAVLPALVASVASSTTGRVLVGTAIKKAAPTAVAKARKSLLGICKVRPDICIGIGVSMAQLYDALKEDGYTVEGDLNPVTNNYDIDIYKVTTGDTCYVQTAFSDKQESAEVTQNAILSYRNKRAIDEHSGLNYRNYSGWNEPYKNFNDVWNEPRNKAQLTEKYALMGWVRARYDVRFIKHDGSGSYGEFTTGGEHSFLTEAWARCVPWNGGDKIHITNNQLNQYLEKNVLTNNQYLAIYNFDYSQHGNVNIAGDTYNGNTINNDLSISAEPELKVSPSLKIKIDNKKVKIDDVNDENCTKNEVGEYDQCGEKEPEPEECEPDTVLVDGVCISEPEKESPIECDANGFYKKVCDWMNWTQKMPNDAPKDTVTVENIESENSNKIDMVGECPAPYELSFSVLGYEQKHTIPYTPLCDALVMLKPIFIGSGALSSMFLLMGYSRPSGTGANDNG